MKLYISTMQENTMLSEGYRLYDNKNTLIIELYDFDKEFDDLFGNLENRDANIFRLAEKYNAHKIIHCSVTHSGQFGNENDEIIYLREVLQSDE
jgi:hypothetical protein